ncbi:MAG: hypothetical protein ACRDP4_09245, partial [Nocardioidaceae bacterium]
RHRDLPVAELDGPSREVRLIVDYWRDLVAERTRVHNRLRWHLHELDPSLGVPSRCLKWYCVLGQLTAKLDTFDCVVARLARELVEHARRLTQQVNALEADCGHWCASSRQRPIGGGIWNRSGSGAARTSGRLPGSPTSWPSGGTRLNGSTVVRQLVACRSNWFMV